MHAELGSELVDRHEPDVAGLHELGNALSDGLDIGRLELHDRLVDRSAVSRRQERLRLPRSCAVPGRRGRNRD
jgi:hypothetical protein